MKVKRTTFALQMIPDSWKNKCFVKMKTIQLFQYLGSEVITFMCTVCDLVGYEFVLLTTTTVVIIAV